MFKGWQRVEKYFLLAALLLVSLLSFGVYVNLRQAAIPVTLSRLERAADLKTYQLNRWFAEVKSNFVEDVEDASLLANATTLLTTPLKIKPEYQQAYAALKAKFNRSEKNRRTTSILTNGGIIVFSTDPSREGQYQPLQNTTTYFTLNNIDNIVPNLYESSLTRESTITFATPLFSPEGRRMGALAVDLNLKELDFLVRESINTLEESANSANYLGKTGESYLVGRLSLVANSFLAAQNPNPVEDKKASSSPKEISKSDNSLKQEPIRAIESYGITRALQGQNGTGLYLNYNKIPVLGSFRRIPQYNLTLLVEVAQSEVFVKAQRSASLIFVGGLGLSAMVSVTTILLRKFPKNKVLPRKGNL